MMLFHAHNIVFTVAISVEWSKQWHTFILIKPYGKYFLIACIARDDVTSKDYVAIDLIPLAIHLVQLRNDKIVVAVAIKIHHR